jgi:hypothetical protein
MMDGNKPVLHNVSWSYVESENVFGHSLALTGVYEEEEDGNIDRNRRSRSNSGHDLGVVADREMARGPIPADVATWCRVAKGNS